MYIIVYVCSYVHLYPCMWENQRKLLGDNLVINLVGEAYHPVDMISHRNMAITTGI